MKKRVKEFLPLNKIKNMGFQNGRHLLINTSSTEIEKGIAK